MYFQHVFSSLALLTGLVTAAYKYPSTVNDTSARDVPFFLAVSEVTTPAYFGKNVQLNYVKGSSTALGVYVNPVNVVGEFVLRNGSLQVASEEKYYATLQPLPTVNGVIRHSFTFTTNSKQNSYVWQLVDISQEGVFGLLNTAADYAQFNGFVICNTTTQYSYEIEYQSSKNGANTKGCQAMALHAFMGPPY